MLLAAGIDLDSYKNKKGVIEHAFLFGILAEAIGDARAKKMNYNSFKKFTAKCSVEVTKEITLTKEGYLDKYDNLVISSEIDSNHIGTLSEPIACEHKIEAIQKLYMDKIAKLNKELATKNTTIQHLENSVADLEDRLKETEI